MSGPADGEGIPAGWTLELDPSARRTDHGRVLLGGAPFRILRLTAGGAAWLRARGFATMRGPMSPSVNDECGLLVEGFDTPPTIMMPHNPPSYVALHERYGFQKAKDLIALESTNSEIPERLTRGAKLI